MRRETNMATSMLQPGIFNNPRPKRNLLPNPNKKRKTEHNVDEISFDDNARADYLTGFHKRKVERAKRRKQELEEHVNAVNAILKEVSGFGEVLDREEEYVDEDRWTTVTVEAVDVSKEGLKKVGEEDSDDAEAPNLVSLEEKGEGKEKKKWPKKEKKKKFRYESKAERKFTRGKQKAGNKARADARKGNS
ncbi:uncharacterized protein K444DRAFT_403737 [Hyaloscypha bicolor E]|uniref:Nucleolar protein 12 n=1 Tax=Hyaloscypha bicolor E TaxID=1095630 RepID=A0A2J6TAF3_9HELO|nr:uncharacterized protein K444DRAFT_403737 [Hyaloscypha bicolor E]PMD60006.1 hypothetical protein K444DRAFT_403737 [Hyaloscypha bicolor E]